LETREAVRRHPGERQSDGERRIAVPRFFWALVGLGLLAALGACGYHLARPGNNLPAEIRRVAIPVMKNETMEPGLEALITDELRRRFAESGWVQLSDAENADAVLVGTIRRFTTTPISFSDSDYAVEYRAQIRLAIRLVDRQGARLWEDGNIVKVREYRSLPDIFATEANKQQAIAWLAREVSAEVHDRIFDGFQ
jgi:outer membrane lipopolysaccharide assembly protein LptE/RlpB